MIRLGFWRRWLLVLLLGGCTSLTPQQTASLKEAQRFADRVVDAYDSGPLRVVVDERWSYYDIAARWVAIQPRLLGSVDQPVVLAPLIGAATLRQEDWSDRNLLAANRRGVEIMVRFLDMSEREAVDRLAAVLVAQNDYLLEEERRAGLDGWRLRWTIRAWHPCAQLRHFWASYGSREPQPSCDPGPGWSDP